MPFSLLILSGDTHGPVFIRRIAAALAFLMVGAGMHTAQTAGIALATDLAPPEQRPRVVAFLYVMLLLGMVGGALVVRRVARRFLADPADPGRAGRRRCHDGVEPRSRCGNRKRATRRARLATDRASFRSGLAKAAQAPGSIRLLVVVGLGTAAFSMQDILLEPYGGEILGMSVSNTTFMTALLAGGTLCGFSLAAFCLSRGFDPYRLAANGPLIGVVAFTAVIFSSPLEFHPVAAHRHGADRLRRGSVLGRHAAGRDVDCRPRSLAVWRSAAGARCRRPPPALPSQLGGAIRDGMSALAVKGSLGVALMNPVHRLQHRLAYRNRADVRHPGGDRPAHSRLARRPLASATDVSGSLKFQFSKGKAEGMSWTKALSSVRSI